MVTGEAVTEETDSEATTETVPVAVDDMWKSLKNAALLFAGIVKLIASTFMNIAYNLFQWKSLKSDERMSDNQTIDWKPRAVHPESSDMLESTSDEDCSSRYLSSQSAVYSGLTVRRRRELSSSNYPEEPLPLMLPPLKTYVVDLSLPKNELIVTEQPVAMPGPSYFSKKEVETESEFSEISSEEGECVEYQQSTNGGNGVTLTEESEEMEKPGRCLMCCGFWLECADGLIP